MCYYVYIRFIIYLKYIHQVIEMKVAVIGSRTINSIPLETYLPPETTELVSGGAKGVDQCSETYAAAHQIKLTVFLPDYARYRRGAPLRRNRQIVDYSDLVLAFWDGSSRGTGYTVDYCRTAGKAVQVILL